MSGVIIDNWNLQNVGFNELVNRQEESIPNEAYSNLLYSIVLWDNIYFLQEDNYMTGWKDNPILEKAVDYIKGLEVNTTVDRQIYEKAADIFKKNYTNYTEIVAERAIFYLLKSNHLGYNYFPIECRAEFLSTEDRIQTIFSRSDIMNVLDKDILDYYNELNSKLGKRIVGMKSPLLIEYIMKNSNNNENYVETAIQIRNTKELAAYRKMMDDLEVKVNQGNFAELEHLINIIPDIISDVRKIDKGMRFSGDLQLGIAPVLNFPFEISLFPKKKVHLSFLKTLSQFAIKGKVSR